MANPRNGVKPAQSNSENLKTSRKQNNIKTKPGQIKPFHLDIKKRNFESTKPATRKRDRNNDSKLEKKKEIPIVPRNNSPIFLILPDQPLYGP